MHNSKEKFAIELLMLIMGIIVAIVFMGFVFIISASYCFFANVQLSVDNLPDMIILWYPIFGVAGFVTGARMVYTDFFKNADEEDILDDDEEPDDDNWIPRKQRK